MPSFVNYSLITKSMERIRSIEQLRMQKELLQLQQMIAELRMRKEIHEMRRKVALPKLIVSSLPSIVSAGIKTPIGKQLLFSAGTKLAKKIFKRKKVKWFRSLATATREHRFSRFTRSNREIRANSCNSRKFVLKSGRSPLYETKFNWPAQEIQHSTYYSPLFFGNQNYIARLIQTFLCHLCDDR